MVFELTPYLDILVNGLLPARKHHVAVRACDLSGEKKTGSLWILSEKEDVSGARGLPLTCDIE